jgi:hypothetical protein
MTTDQNIVQAHRAAKRKANGRPAKLTEQELASRAQAHITAAHAQPRYDLSAEPWLPVLRDGQVVTVGLRELLADAAAISDVALPNALVRASVRRWLLALTADLVRRDRSRTVEDWEDAHEANSGFTDEQIDAMLAVHGEHLWLWHPSTPFLQDPRLARISTKPHADLPVQDLVLHLPSGSSAAWWIKAGEPALHGGLSPDQTALWLLARWFYAANGNCGDIRLPTGGTVGAQAGGAYAETVAVVTHAFRVDGTSLFRTLLRGLPHSLAPSAGFTDVTAQGGCAWLDQDQPRPSSDALYVATLNAGAVLLTGRNEAGDTTHFLRGATPIPAEVAKNMRDHALREDRHRITALNDRGAVQAVRVPPGALRGEMLYAFHRAGFDGQRLTGVVSSTDCWLHADAATVDAERLDILLVGKGGTGSSPVWEELLGVELPARQVDPEHPDRHVTEHVRAAVQIAFDPKIGVRQRLEWAVADLLSQPGPDGWKRPKRDNATARALTNAAISSWLGRSAAALDAVLASDTPEALETWKAAAWSAARAAFDDVAQPYITSTRYAPRYAVALRWLTPRSST